MTTASATGSSSSSGRSRSLVLRAGVAWWMCFVWQHSKLRAWVLWLEFLEVPAEMFSSVNLGFGCSTRTWAIDELTATSTTVSTAGLQKAWTWETFVLSRLCSYPVAVFCLFELILCTKALRLTKRKWPGRRSSGAITSGSSQASVATFCRNVSMFTGQDDIWYVSIFTGCVCFVLVLNWSVDVTRCCHGKVCQNTGGGWRSFAQWCCSSCMKSMVEVPRHFKRPTSFFDISAVSLLNSRLRLARELLVSVFTNCPSCTSL